MGGSLCVKIRHARERSLKAKTGNRKARATLASAQARSGTHAENTIIC
jgi:hypothetical protein